MANEPPDPSPELEPRDPTTSDLVALCRELNSRGARYLICGGFAIRAAGYARHTGDIDLLIDDSFENEALVFSALEYLPDKAVRLLDEGDIQKYVVCRVADEILVDLMGSASGIEYEEASKAVVIKNVSGVDIPFASPLLLWRMKRHTHREKDRPDLLFLRQLLEAEGIAPPDGPIGLSFPACR
jgi:hypothetical protein